MAFPNCHRCGGTRLMPARGGAERGSCHCPREGRLVVKRFYATDTRPAYDETRIEWQGRLLDVVFSNVDEAAVVLESLRNPPNGRQS